MAAYVSSDDTDERGPRIQGDRTDETHAVSVSITKPNLHFHPPRQGSTRQCEDPLQTSFNNDVLAKDHPSLIVDTNHNRSTLSSKQQEDSRFHSENQKKAEQLRARLIAQRQNTPTRNLDTLRPTSALDVADTHVQPTTTLSLQMKTESLSDEALLSLDNLLTEGRAAAEAVNAEHAARKSYGSVGIHSAPFASASRLANNGVPGATPTQTDTGPPMSPDPQGSITVLAEGTGTPIAPPKVPDDSYYTDLSEWLEMTGYHDMTFRSAKLAPFKERKTLEKEASRIRARLEKLKEEEQAVIIALRTSVGCQAPLNEVARPPLPDALLSLVLPSASAANTTDSRLQLSTQGQKRQHSPETPSTEKTPRDSKIGEYRFRGANGMSEHRSGAVVTPIEPKSHDRRTSQYEPDDLRSHSGSDLFEWRHRTTGGKAPDNRHDHGRENFRDATSYGEHDCLRPPPYRGKRYADMHSNDSYTYSRR